MTDRSTPQGRHSAREAAGQTQAQVQGQTQWPDRAAAPSRGVPGRAGHIPGPSSGQAPGQLSGHVPGPSSGQAPGPLSGQAPGHAPGQSSGHVPGQDYYQAVRQDPGRGPRPRPEGMPSVLAPQRAPEHWRDDRTARPRPRRGAKDVFAGIGAFIALVGLVGGVPYALLRLAGPPISGDLLNLDLFTDHVGPETVIAILVLLVWLAWLQLFLCVIVEVYAGLRRVGMPARVPLSGGTQALANRLVGAVLLLFTATAAVVPIARAGAPVVIKPQTVAAAAVLSAPVPQTEADRPALHAREVKKVYVVQPPHGRHHESLWEIADKCLGDGRRYPEIYQLNQHKEQPDGSRLHMADLIRPGWVLDMPDDARNVHVVPVDEDRPEILGEHRNAPAELDGTTRYGGGAGEADTKGDVRAHPRPTPHHTAGGAQERSHATPDPRASAGGTGSHGGTAGGERDTTLPDQGSGDTPAGPGGNVRHTPPAAGPATPRPEGTQHQGDARHEPGRVTPQPGKPGVVLPPPAMPQDPTGAHSPGHSGKATTPDAHATGKATTPDAHATGRATTPDAHATGEGSRTPRPITTTTAQPAAVGEARPTEHPSEQASGRAADQPGAGSAREEGQPRTHVRPVAEATAPGHHATASPSASSSAPSPGATADAHGAPAAAAGDHDGSGPEKDGPGEDGRGEEGQRGGPVLADYLAASSLAAAGLLALLGRRRREQLWRRAFGRRIARPRGDAAEAEVAIRLGADAPGSRMLDIGLRLLGRLLADSGRRPPTIYAVHLSSRGLDLWIHPAEQDAPEPWEACDGGQVWRLPAHEGRRIDEHALAGVPAPYPGLVSLGTGQGGRVLVDLEAAHGIIAITGAHTVAALSALAVELATNRWSDDMRLTLVGFGEELALLAPERIRTAGSLAEVLPEFEERGRHDGDVLTGRVHSRVADPAYTPHYLLSAIRPDEDEARRLALLGKGTRTATGFVIAGAVPHATWKWDITDGGRTRVDALGLDIEAHLLPRRHYDAVVGLFRTALRQESEPLTPVTERLSEEPPAIEVRVLGPIEISPVNPLEEGRAALAHELVVYLATHPDGVHPVVLAGVLWPRGVQTAVRDATIARVAEWLGRDSEGRPHLFADRSGRLRLGPEIRTDWRLFQDLIRQASEWAGTSSSGEVEEDLLNRALRLVRGPLLSGRPPDRYAWLAADPLEYDVTAWVADAAHQLCEIRLRRDDPYGAVAAARAGLLLAADDEGLWRDLLRASHATGEPVRLRAVVDGLVRRAASHPYGGGMAPETEALIDELLPDWRRTLSPDLRTQRLA
ncbi:hypothetical protein [Microbispora triticiradicis]|uniref:hypothetical protein n=1 Tax=Microbispora triticiradicis TaxID=2200763 RepID=UPI001AD80015|nr:hypothetical protein [Microbispora triticiradicis]